MGERNRDEYCDTPTYTVGVGAPAGVALRPQPPSQRILEKVFFGGVSCMVAGLVTHPLDTVKIRLQIQQIQPGVALRSLPYQGWWGTTRCILREEGWRGLFKGVTPSLVREATYSALRFGLYDSCKSLVVSARQSLPSLNASKTKMEDSFFTKLVAGFLAGGFSASMTTPADVMKVRLQNDSSGKRFNGRLRDAWKTTWTEEGIRGIYAGIVPNVARASILTASQLATYDQTKKIIQSTGFFGEDIICHFSAAIVSGFITTLVSSPADVAKSRMMNDSTRYRGFFNCLVTTVRLEGISALFKGFLPSYFRVAPHTVISLVVFEKLRNLFGIDPV